MKTDIAVLGGGASGLAAAIAAKEANMAADVTVIEKLPRIGKKIIATGNGKCNLSNLSLKSHNFHGSINAMSIISATPDWQELFTEKLGVVCSTGNENQGGGVYPRSNSSATVLNAFRLKLAELGVNEKCDCEIKAIKCAGDGFELDSDSERITCRRLIIAAGGYAAPAFGTDGAVLRMLRDMKLETSKLCPAVAPLRVAPESVKGLKGVRIKGEVSAVSGDKTLHTEKGEIQFNENNISGICVFNLAYLFQRYEGRLNLLIDLAPDMTEQELADYFFRIRKSRGDCTAEELLTGFFVRNLAVWLMKNGMGKSPAEPMSAISDKDIRKLCGRIKRLSFAVTGCSPWQNAQSTMGGVTAGAVDRNLESKRYRGMFLCGEILDVAGDCGGYNLQWAWSSGTWAGINAAKSLKGGKR